MLNLKNRAVALFAALMLALVSVPALATPAGPDVTSVTTAISDAATPIASIGGAVLVLLVGIKVYRWIRRAM